MKDQRTARVSALGRPLERLASLGLACPPQWTLTRFLDLLVTEGVLSAAAARSYLTVHYEAQYGTATVEAGAVVEAMGPILRELEQAAASDGAALARVAAAVPHRPPRIASVARKATPVGGTAAGRDDPAGRPAPERATSRSNALAPILSRRAPSAWRRLSLGGALVLWSLLLVGLGCLGQPLLTRLWTDLRVRVLRQPQLVSPEERLRAAREHAARQPGVPAAWLAYANLADAQGRHGEAVLAYRHLIARDPGNPELLNALAWLYCTASDQATRDPLQALALAEQAYASSQEPHITDTLAEAAFQNGDVQRAIALEEDALRRAAGNPDFYRQQLAKFQAAGGRKRGSSQAKE